MIISHKHKFISLDPPKTGTNYRQNLLWNSGDYLKGFQHANLAEVQNYFHEFNLSDYFIFTFVRNPWDRFLSFYNWSNLPLDPDSFGSRLKGHLGRQSTKPQSHWYIQDGVIVTDFIGSLENMHKDMKLILNKINLPLTLPSKKSNQSKITLNVKDFYNQELIDLVAEKEKNVIQLKGYDFI